MPGTRRKLTSAVEDYLSDLCLIRASGGATGELSYHAPLYKLLNAIGGTLRPGVFCINEMAQQGAGHPDFGLYAAKQVRKGLAVEGQLPECGVVEVKSAADDAWLTADSEQVSKYWNKYRLVLVTNTRDFVLLGEDTSGKPTKLETFRLAESAAAFESRLQDPRVFASEVGVSLGEYLCRALSLSATIVEPRELARLLASYARDGLARVEAAGDAPSLATVRSALEGALGVRFEGDRGSAFFRSTLVQTLFYGIFSAWVLWSRQSPPPTGPFNWHDVVWHLRFPVLEALFQQVSSPNQLHPLGLVETLDWTAMALDRVDREAFFTKFSEGEAVPYFYEPFLEEFDPALRKQFGVWYTPPEVVRYMVARVDRALKDDLGIADGLAAENVYILDPCCGTGAYLSEVLCRIAANMKGKGLGALTGAQVRQAAAERVFGFEIMPAPFVVAHLQIGLTMQALDAPFSESGKERAGVFLTNALTGWEPRSQKPLPFPELEEERDKAERVKQEAPVLVILGNPPYNGRAGKAFGDSIVVDEEQELSNAYRTTKQVRSPEGQGLTDLYIRFFRMAERRIAEKTGQGVVCFISNYSWLDGLSFTGMRERYLEAFDVIRIDCLNGDTRKTGKTTPDGTPDPSIFSTREDPIGIQVGTAITTLVRKADHAPAKTIGLRHLWGQAKREELTATTETAPSALYESIEPNLLLGLPFAHTTVGGDWHNSPSLPDLFPKSFSGVKTARDGFLVDIDLDQLKQRIVDYFDPDLSNDVIGQRYPVIMQPAGRYDAHKIRESLLKTGGHEETGFVRYAYRPFDDRWLYWEAETKLLDERRADYKPHIFEGNLWLSSSHRIRKGETEPQTAFTRHIASYHLIERVSNWFPAWLRDDAFGEEVGGVRRRQNLSLAAEDYLKRLGLGVEDLFHHVLAVLHDPVYRETNGGALLMEWPRIPLPGWPDGNVDGAADALAASAALGRELAALLDSDKPVPGVTTGALRPELEVVAIPTTNSGQNMAGDDFAVSVGWGHLGAGGAVMPGQGGAAERAYTQEEQMKLGDSVRILGETTFDVYLNDHAYWRNVPTAVWNYKLGGYQVLKKWLSYRERKVLGRPLIPEEVRYFTDTVRRITAILLLVNR